VLKKSENQSNEPSVRHFSDGQKDDMQFSGGAMDYEDGEVNDLSANDAHAKKSLPKELVDQASMSRGKGHRVSMSRSKHDPQD